MIQNIGCFHLGSASNLRPLDILEKDIKTELAKNGESCLADSIIVLPEAFNLIGRYEPGESYDVKPSSGLTRISHAPSVWESKAAAEPVFHGP